MLRRDGLTTSFDCSLSLSLFPLGTRARGKSNIERDLLARSLAPLPCLIHSVRLGYLDIRYCPRHRRVGTQLRLEGEIARADYWSAIGERGGGEGNGEWMGIFAIMQDCKCPQGVGLQEMGAAERVRTRIFVN